MRFTKLIPVVLSLLVSTCSESRQNEDENSFEDVKPGEGDGETGDGDPGDDSDQSDESDESDDGDDDDDDNTWTGDPDDEESSGCGEIELEVEPLPPNLMLVIDKSGSMTSNSWIDNGVEQRRWQSLHTVVSELFTEFDTRVNFGAKLFPIDGASNMDPILGCQVDPGVHVEIGPMTGQAILAVMPGKDDLFEGRTPTNTGLTDAVTYVKTIEDENPEAIILVIDGRTNCEQTNVQVAATAADALANEIPVYVVGIDLDPMVTAELDSVAQAGGTEKTFNTATATALKEALEKLITELTSCTIGLDPEPQYPEFVEVDVNGELVPWLEGYYSCEEAAAAGEPDGWVYTKEGPPWDEMELCGENCKIFQSTHKVHVKYECPPPE